MGRSIAAACLQRWRAPARSGVAGEARAAPAREGIPRAELDAGALGLRPNAADDQSQIFQRAIEQAARRARDLAAAAGLLSRRRFATAALHRDQRRCRRNPHRDGGRRRR